MFCLSSYVQWFSSYRTELPYSIFPFLYFLLSFSVFFCFLQSILFRQYYCGWKLIKPVRGRMGGGLSLNAVAVCKIAPIVIWYSPLLSIIAPYIRYLKFSSAYSHSVFTHPYTDSMEEKEKHIFLNIHFKNWHSLPHNKRH